MIIFATQRHATEMVDKKRSKEAACSSFSLSSRVLFVKDGLDGEIIGERGIIN